MADEPFDLNGVKVFFGEIRSQDQGGLVKDLRKVILAAPLFSPMTPYGKPMSVRMTSCGRYGWFSDRRGYRYIDRHPSGAPWPDIPERLMALWAKLVPGAREPECCLINYYGDHARMGMHQDKDEKDFSQPVLSVSLGDDALFRVGGVERGGKTGSVWLRSGDVAVLQGTSRLAYHGVDKIRHKSSRLLPYGGRINLTMRVVG
jgi:alkylated DNA repair protein (DNA oxidative demethylase)